MTYGQSYFPHDTNASNDPKLLALRAAFGWEGIGVFWATVEALHNNGGELSRPLWGGHGVAIGWPLPDLEAFLEYCLELDLFQGTEGGGITHHRVLETLEARRQAAENGRKGAGLRWGNSHPNRVAIASKGKERKVKERNVEGTDPSETDGPTPAPVVLDTRYVFPAVGTPSVWSPTVDQVQGWRDLFPGLDVDACMAHALAWVQATPSRRKTARGYARFLVGWFGREQNRGNNRLGTYANLGTNNGGPVRDGRGADRSVQGVQQARNDRAERWGISHGGRTGTPPGEGGLVR